MDGWVEGNDYLQGLEEYIFCLAATGDGWGVRLKLAVLFRCIPAIIADQIQVKFLGATMSYTLNPVVHAMYIGPCGPGKALVHIT